MKTPSRWVALGRDILDLFAPVVCIACCDAPPTVPAQGTAVVCGVCGIALEPPEDPPDGIFVPFAHGGPLAGAVYRAKYDGDPSVARRLGSLLVKPLSDLVRQSDVVVPVPLHPRRLRARGYNQATELARALGLPIAHDAVERVRDTPSQVGRNRAERHANVSGAFALRKPQALAHRRLLVIDDVVTTGATLTELRTTLLDAGPHSVQTAALFRAPLADPR